MDPDKIRAVSMDDPDEVGSSSKAIPQRKDSGNEQKWYPIETSTFPSGGLPYRSFSTVEIRSFNIFEVEKASEANSRNADRVIRDILAATIKIPVATLTRGDLIYLLFWQRINTFDPYYEIRVPCLVCNKAFNVRYDLRTLSLKKLDSGWNPDRVLEIGSHFIQMDLMRQRNEVEAEKYQKIFPELNFNVILYASAITTIDGEKKTLQEKLDFLTKELTDPRQYNAIRGYHEYYLHGVSLDIQVDCPVCKEALSLELPFRADLFIPTGLDSSDIASQISHNA